MSRGRPETRLRGSAPLTLLAALGAGLFLLPVLGLALGVPWRRLGELLTGEVAIRALRLSLIASLSATLVSTVVGVPLAWTLARVEFPGRSLVRRLVLLPMVVPPVVGGILLLIILGREGPIGRLLAGAGIVLPFTTAGVVVAATFVSMPFLVVTVEGALRGLDPRYEAVAAGLGAGRWTVLRRVTIPMILPSLLSGMVLTWARALGEFGATITFAGNLAGTTQTLPLAVYVSLGTDRSTALALSLVMVAVSFAVLLVMRGEWWGRT